ncbi:UDP-N-acetylmuramate dehydrogenase [Salinibacterium sp. NSLL150]|uniref:UDP-N-acetylmuramate dehydrogenase n=1 Tax=unclassified Salinibacterium TaxID=2632331 RepID=UPI0018CD78C1|nr:MULTISPECIES: UDP-N-acetylmuramate dehydrogenase [unclassified Salinibacterium]MBH0024947.1 UDP-N-acetylmuramate dehydrogenase [Salinibacterium sp. SWN248]MBH0099852.1 UDP-N-acetylmuramate dehydrogenase [Salinibacterium sp. NSLL35]MBH0102606.1 UDP-N-acetylmuramate dehydrogenase [Salinibacterium sp. NSLL150]MBH0105366.1 UDP-N-acetylmuramate dehydrogenase [Salinibacterium sp. NSLL16]MBH0108126.1 UDP-N-acetylmuramate dehydrogenase [Salinibacterium sp. NSLL17]
MTDTAPSESTPPQYNVALADLTTIKVGGPAHTLLRPATEQELIANVRDVWQRGDEWLLIGGGSNMVISDEGFDGTVIHIATRGIQLVSQTETSLSLRVQAGESWDGLVAKLVSRGWAGLEALSGIPGSVGAAPIQNIGAYGQEVASVLDGIDFLDYDNGEFVHLTTAELELGYRNSVIKEGRAGVVLAVYVTLAASPESTVQYQQLATALGVNIGDRVPVQQVRDTVLALRASKAMVLDPNEPDSASCGSFFTNPIVPEHIARGLPADAPRWVIEDEPVTDVAVPLGEEPAPPPAPKPRLVKLSAAWLIEHSGVNKGFRLPGSRAAVSTKHSLAIVNRTGADAAEVAELARYIGACVLSRYGIYLQPEPVGVGVELA